MAERAIQNTEQIAQVMLIEAQLPIVFWCFAVMAVAYITNRTTIGPTINKKHITPYEAWFKRQPSIDHFRIWGCKCIILIPEKKRQSKLHP